MLLVDLGDGDVTSAQAQAGVSFPFVVEGVDAVEFDCAERVDEEAEHATGSDGGELQGVAELGGRQHAGFVDDHGGADGKVVTVIGWAVEAVLDEQLVERVGDQPGLVG